MRDITEAPPSLLRHTEAEPSIQFKDLIERCHICVQKSIPHPEPLIPTPLPEYPWQKVFASDMFVLNGDSYLIIVDYFSRYLEVIKLNSTS